MRAARGWNCCRRCITCARRWCRPPNSSKARSSEIVPAEPGRGGAGRCRHPRPDRCRGARDMGRRGRAAAALRRAAAGRLRRRPRRGGRPAAAGAAARRRAHRRRRDELGRAARAGALRRQLAVLRPRRARRMSPSPRRCWPSPDPTWPTAPSRRSPTARRWSPARRSATGRWCCSTSRPMPNGRRCRCRACSCRCSNGSRSRPAPARPTGASWPAPPGCPTRCSTGSARSKTRATAPACRAKRSPARPAPDLPPGLYRAESRLIAVNVVGAETALAPAAWPAGVTPEWQGARTERDLSGWLFLAALALLGAESSPRSRCRAGCARGATAVLLAAVLLPLPTCARRPKPTRSIRPPSPPPST